MIDRVSDPFHPRTLFKGKEYNQQRIWEEWEEEQLMQYVDGWDEEIVQYLGRELVWEDKNESRTRGAIEMRLQKLRAVSQFDLP